MSLNPKANNFIIQYTSRILRHVKRRYLHLANSSGKYHCGHFYNPIPSALDIKSIPQNACVEEKLDQLTINFDIQQRIFNQMKMEYHSLNFPELQTTNKRFYCQNSYYSHMDAMTLSMMIRIFRPSTIIEIGSGFSSAAVIDTVEEVRGYSPQITFVEPYPDRLHSLIKGHTTPAVKIIESNVQATDLSMYASLQENDLLVVDSSHVIKYNSDLAFLFFEVIPLLAKGVIIHFHDIWQDFEYPAKWLQSGTYWNEAYFLRAFLANNDSWQAIFMTDFMSHFYKSEYEESMPRCLSSSGSSFYIQRFK